MKNAGQIVKECGVLRGLCGILISKTPQGNRMKKLALCSLLYVAGSFLYPVTRAHAHAHTHVCVVSKKTPQHPANGSNSLNDSGMTCGVLAYEDPAKTPQFAGCLLAVGRWTS